LLYLIENASFVALIFSLANFTFVLKVLLTVSVLLFMFALHLAEKIAQLGARNLSGLSLHQLSNLGLSQVEGHFSFGQVFRLS
jgi:hypothetical protein